MTNILPVERWAQPIDERPGVVALCDPMTGRAMSFDHPPECLIDDDGLRSGIAYLFKEGERFDVTAVYGKVTDAAHLGAPGSFESDLASTDVGGYMLDSMIPDDHLDYLTAQFSYMSHEEALASDIWRGQYLAAVDGGLNSYRSRITAGYREACRTLFRYDVDWTNVEGDPLAGERIRQMDQYVAATPAGRTRALAELTLHRLREEYYVGRIGQKLGQLAQCDGFPTGDIRLRLHALDTYTTLSSHLGDRFGMRVSEHYPVPDEEGRRASDFVSQIMRRCEVVLDD